MPRVYIVVGLVLIAITVYAVVNAIMTARSRTRGLPKVLWILVILVLPLIGPVLWFTLGKDRGRRSSAPRPTAPDDDPDFLRKLGSEKEQQERIRRMEQELADLDDDSSAKE